jgi:glutaminyl-tRNA synthetase
LFQKRKSEIEEKRYTILGSLLGDLRKELRWAQATLVKAEVDKQLLSTLGPKDHRDDPKAVSKHQPLESFDPKTNIVHKNH